VHVNPCFSLFLAALAAKRAEGTDLAVFTPTVQSRRKRAQRRI